MIKSCPTIEDFRECLELMDSFRSFDHHSKAYNLDLNTQSIRLFLDDLTETLKRKEGEINKSSPYKWLTNNPSYKLSFNAIFGGHVDEKWGKNLVEKFTNLISKDLSQQKQDNQQFEEKALFWRKFLAGLATANANSWARCVLGNSYIFLFNRNDICWRNVGFPQMLDSEVKAQLELIKKLLEEYYYQCSPKLRTALIAEAESLERQINVNAIKNFSPIMRNDETSPERYFIYNLWLWFVDRDLSPPAASTFSELLNIVGASLGERSIERQFKRWREEYGLYDTSTKELFHESQEEGVYLHHVDSEIELVQELILMQVKKLPWR